MYQVDLATGFVKTEAGTTTGNEIHGFHTCIRMHHMYVSMGEVYSWL